MFDLTIGMPTYKDFDGVYFTTQALRLYQETKNCEFVIVDNYGCSETEKFIKSWIPNSQYILLKKNTGTAYAKNHIFEAARSKYVLCIDCHVLLLPGVISKLIKLYKDFPDYPHLAQGPMYYDDFKNAATHMDPVWRGQMFGIWGYDARVTQDLPFEIPLHGMGLFSCTKDSWVGFNSRFSGFGGEEGYIHEKFRQQGKKCWCYPWLAWTHRFGRPNGVPYPLFMEDKVKNYIYGHLELGLDLQEIYDHFKDFIDLDFLKRCEADCLTQLNRIPDNFGVFINAT